MARKPKYSSLFKSCVVREALKGELIDAEIGGEHCIYPVVFELEKTPRVYQSMVN